jgi:hypothetical protein
MGLKGQDSARRKDLWPKLAMEPCAKSENSRSAANLLESLRMLLLAFESIEWLAKELPLLLALFA